MKARWLALLPLTIASALAWAADAPAAGGDILTRIEGKVNLQDLLANNAPANISAAGFLELDAEAVKPVENLRDIVVSLSGLSNNGVKATLGIGFTPARSSLTPMNLSTYDKGWFYRALGSTTIGYAQGNKTIESKDFERRALSIETSFYWFNRDDPILALVDALRKGANGCKDIFGGPAQPSGSGVTQPATPARPAAPATPSDAAVPSSGDNGPRRPAENPDAVHAVKARVAECKAKHVDTLRWNRSQAFGSYATGWIKPTDGSTRQETLGRTVVLGATYGFDGTAKLLENGAALTLSVRKTWSEPVLASLVTGPVERKSNSLLFARFAGGSESFRAVAEASNARSNGATTPSERAFKAALGVDVKVASLDGLWIALRVGKQKTVNGNDTEIGSLLTISYSPTALLSGR